MYDTIIQAFKKGTVVPFLGPGASYTRESDILKKSIIEQLESFLRISCGHPTEELIGPGSICYKEPGERPFYCPLLQKILESSRNGADGNMAPQLIDDLQLAVAKMNIRYSSQYKRFSYKKGPEDFYKLIQKEYEDNIKFPPNSLHNFLASLPKKMEEKLKSGVNLPYPLIVTTNFDDLLERAFDEIGQSYDSVFYVAEKQGKFEQGDFVHSYKEGGREKLAKIHQNYNNLPIDEKPIILKLYGMLDKNFVITEEHHIKFMTGEDFLGILPTDLLLPIQRDRILFLGYTPNDWELQFILDRFWKSQQGEVGEKSWFVSQTGLGYLEEKLWNNRGIDKDDFIPKSLEKFISELQQEINLLPTFQAKS